jgi:hypothetical protein
LQQREAAVPSQAMASSKVRSKLGESERSKHDEKRTGVYEWASKQTNKQTNKNRALPMRRSNI